MVLVCSLIFSFPYTLWGFLVFFCFSLITCNLFGVVLLFPLASNFCVVELIQFYLRNRTL